MNDFRPIPTTPEVWAVLRARHHEEMEIHSTHTDMDGGLMETTHSFKNSDLPFLRAVTKWDEIDEHGQRINERHSYWLYAQFTDPND